MVCKVARGHTTSLDLRLLLGSVAYRLENYLAYARKNLSACAIEDL